MKFDLDWGVFFHEIPGGGDRYADLLVSGVAWTLALSASAGVLAVVLGAGVGEGARPATRSLPRGQLLAGRARGLTQPQVYRHVLLPMAFRIVIPPLTSETMNLIKNSWTAVTIGLP